jgi:hypothetical protein
VKYITPVCRGLGYYLGKGVSMSAEPDMLINQAERAYDDARAYRNSAEERKYAGRVNIENALESAQQASQAQNETDATYWKEKAEYFQQQVDSEVRDLEGKAEAKEREGKKYKEEARAVAEHEYDEQKKNRWFLALHVLDTRE